MAEDCAIHAILFDSDNTLYDYKSAQLAACEALITYVGAGDAANLNSYFLLNPFNCENHLIIKYYFNDIGIFEDELLHNAYDVYNSKKMENTILFDGVYETIALLKEREILLGIVTNAQAGYVFSCLEKTNIKDFFQCIISPEVAHSKKPALGPFELALSLLAAKSRNSLMVGDNTINDLVPAKKLGMKTILFKNEKGDEQLIHTKYPDVDYYIVKFNCILDILDKISP